MMNEKTAPVPTFVLTGLYCPYCGKQTFYQTDVIVSAHNSLYVPDVIHVCSSCESAYLIFEKRGDLIDEVKRQLRLRDVQPLKETPK